MATGPKVATSPLEVLTNDGTREPYFFEQYWAPVGCGSIGFLTIVLTNWAMKKPVMSGFYRHVIATAFGAGLGSYKANRTNTVRAERDAVLRHYIQLHPEEFPDFTRQKYGQLLEPWVPIR